MAAQRFTALDDPELINLIKQGAVGVIPSDTVYGLVCVANNQTAVERLFTVKPREHTPGTLLAATIDQLVNLGLSAADIESVKDYWPNSLSIIVAADRNLGYLHMGLDSLAVRIPADAKLRDFLAKVAPIMTTSANLPGEPVAETIEEAVAYFGDSVDFYVDGGALRDRPASTIIKIVDGVPEIIREGAVKIEHARRIIS